MPIVMGNKWRALRGMILCFEVENVILAALCSYVQGRRPVSNLKTYTYLDIMLVWAIINNGGGRFRIYYQNNTDRTCLYKGREKERGQK